MLKRETKKYKGIGPRNAPSDRARLDPAKPLLIYAEEGEAKMNQKNRAPRTTSRSPCTNGHLATINLRNTTHWLIKLQVHKTALRLSSGRFCESSLLYKFILILGEP